MPKPTEKTNDKPVEKPEKILRKNSDIDKWWNPHTKMVFKSSDELIVIGVCNNKKINELSNDDIATCRKYGFKYETISKNKEEPSKKKAVEKKEQPIKKAVEKKEQPVEKSKISIAINKTNLSAKDVEDVLSELKLSNEEEDDDEYVNEEDVENVPELEVELEDAEEDAEEEEEYEEEEELLEDEE